MSLLSSITELADRLLRPAAFNLLIPFMPGSLLIFGLASIYSEHASKLVAYPKLFGEATIAVLAVFSAYLSGVVLLYVVNAFGQVSGYLLGYFWAAKYVDQGSGYDWSKHETWRRTAAAFLGSQLSPSLETEMDQKVFTKWLEYLDQIDDPQVKYEKQRELLNSHYSGMKADHAWHSWYDALGYYFPTPQPISGTDFDFSTSVQSCGWAGVILLSFSSWSHWLPWIVSLGAVGGGFMFEIFSAIIAVSSHRATHMHQMAWMLREMRSQSPASGIKQ